MSKQAYTQCLTPWVSNRVKIPGAILADYNGLVAKRDELYNMYGADDYQVSKAQAKLDVCRLELKVYNGNATHLFLPNINFCNWLVDCVPKLSQDQLLAVQQLAGDNAIVVHFPTSSKKRGLLFELIDANGTHAVILSILPNVGSRLCTGIQALFNDIPVKEFDVLKCREDLASVKENGEERWYVKFIAGLGLYTACFPDAIVDGVPEDLKHPAHHNFKHIKTIGIVDKIRQNLGGTHASPTAHYRIGYFKTLRSEKFTHKRFQVIWIDGVFVKGHSKVVLDLEAVDAAQNIA